MGKRLLKAGASLTAADDDGQTACHAAASGGHVNIVRFFLEHDAPSCAVPDALQWIPLHLAAAEGHVDLARLLLGASSDLRGTLDLRTKEGSTLMHVSAARGHADLIRMLIELAPPELLEAENDRFMPPLQ